jgi:hypothetical protein
MRSSSLCNCIHSPVSWAGKPRWEGDYIHIEAYLALLRLADIAVFLLQIEGL